MKNAKNVRKLFVVLLILCYVDFAIGHAFATTIEPKIGTCIDANATLTILSNSASCYVCVTAKSSQYKITADMTLYRIDGTSFKPIKTWTITAADKISTTKTFYVTSGYDYQVIVYITVKDSSGKKLESFTVNSPVVHY